jgi:NitT/TauT family transport system ATP-binding protein
VIFQEASLYPWLTALENIEFPLSLRGTPKADMRRRAEAMLELVGLHGFGTRFPHELSGGMKQRVSIARGLVQDPPVLLMDEPFAALDDITRQALNADLLQWWRAGGDMTALFVTHSVAEAVFLSQRVLVMGARPGRVVAEVALGEPYPRDAGFRHSARFSEACRELGNALARTHGAPAGTAAGSTSGTAAR